MEPAVSLLAGMPVCYIYRQQEGLTERTLAWATSRRLTDEVRSSFTDFQDWCDENNDRWSQALDSGLSSVIEKYIDGRFY